MLQTSLGVCFYGVSYEKSMFLAKQQLLTPIDITPDEFYLLFCTNENSLQHSTGMLGFRIRQSTLGTKQGYINAICSMLYSTVYTAAFRAMLEQGRRHAMFYGIHVAFTIRRVDLNPCLMTHVWSMRRTVRVSVCSVVFVPMSSHERTSPHDNILAPCAQN